MATLRLNEVENFNFDRVIRLGQEGDTWWNGSSGQSARKIEFIDNDIVVLNVPEQTGFVCSPEGIDIMSRVDFKIYIIKNNLKMKDK